MCFDRGWENDYLTSFSVGQSFGSAGGLWDCDSGGKLFFGDGTSACVCDYGGYVTTTVNLGLNTICGRFTRSRTYSSSGPFTAYFYLYRRISYAKNNAASNTRLETIVNTNFAGSPAVSLNPIQVCFPRNEHAQRGRAHAVSICLTGDPSWDDPYNELSSS